MPFGGITAGNGTAAVNVRCAQYPPVSDEAVARDLTISIEKLAALKGARSLSNRDICTMPQKALDRAFARLEHPKADHPGDWAKFRNLQRRSEDGKVKPDGLIKGLEKRKEVLKKKSGREPALISSAATPSTQDPGLQVVSPEAGVNSGQWVPLGPNAVGGRIRAIAIDPANTDRLFLGSVSGGIWKSTDGGASWNPVNDFMGNLSISSLVFSPGDSNIIYAGTGEGFYNMDAVRGAGIFRSTDGGTTWQQMPATDPALDPAWYYVNRIAIDPLDGNRLLAATEGGLYLSTDAGTSWTMVDGRRTLDIRFDPTNSMNAMAAGNFGLVLSSSDGGYSWLTTTLGPNDWLNRVEIAYAASAPGTVYASAADGNGKIWRSNDGGGTWALLSTPQHLGSQGWYNNAIWVDPADANHLVIGGLDLWRSTNGGLNWTRISNWVNNMYNGYPQIPHADHHILLADPGYDGAGNRKLYNGNDGGIFRSNDIALATETTGWQTLNNGLAITQFYSGAGFSSAGGRIIGGTQDNGSQQKPAGGSSWQLFYGGDGGYSAVDRSDDNYIYGEYVYLRIHRSTTGGAASYIYAGITDAGSNANFIAPFILDPNDNNRMLAGGASLWQSLAVKATTPSWTAIKSANGSKISAVAVAEGNSAVAWVGHNDGRVYRSDNSLAGAPAWTRVGSGVLPGRMANRILIDKADTNRVYVAFGGYNADNLYRTADNGQTWTNIAANLPAVPVFTIARHPANGDWLYAGTEVGLFTSQDGGTTWYTTNDGPANVEISELSWMDDSTLLAATHGRGMFKATVVTEADVTPPTVTTVSPAANAVGVPATTAITAAFSEQMDAATLTTGTFSVGNGVTGTVGYNAETGVATFTPSGLAHNTTYTVTITTGVRDLAGNPLQTAQVWTFTTMPPPPVAEGFSGGVLPSGWTVVDTAGTGAVWRFDNPGARTNNTGGTGGFAIADSDYAGTVNVNTELRSPIIDFSSHATATLRFTTDFRHYNVDIAEVDLSSNGAAGPWTNIWRKNADYRGPRAEQIDITSLAAGKSNIMIRFHYYNANYSWWWQLDDVIISGTYPDPVRLLSPAPFSYSTLQEAYDNAADGNVIEAQAVSFTEDLMLFNDVRVSLKGGFDPTYTYNTGGSTIMEGLLKVRNGTVKVENLRFR